MRSFAKQTAAAEEPIAPEEVIVHEFGHHFAALWPDIEPLAVADALVRRDPTTRITCLGTAEGLEALTLARLASGLGALVYIVAEVVPDLVILQSRVTIARHALLSRLGNLAAEGGV